MMPGTTRKTAIIIGKKMAWNMNLEGTPVPSNVTQSVVAEPSAAAIASAMSALRVRLGFGM